MSENARRNPTSNPWPDLIYGLAVVLVLGSALWALFDHFSIISRTLAFPYPLAYSESLSVDRALQLPDLTHLYPTTFSTPPLRISPQPPLFPALLAPLLHAVTAADAFAATRTLSLFAFCVTGLAAAGTVFGLTRSFGGAVITCVMLWLFPQIQVASLLVAPDAAALALGTLGLCIAVLFGTHDSARSNSAVALSGLCFVLCIGMQPEFVIVPLTGACIWLLRNGRRNATLILLASIAVCSVTAAAWLQVITNGGFLQHLLNFGVRDFSKDVATWLIINQLLRTGLILVPSILFFITEPLGARHVAARPLLIMLMTAFILTILSSRVGSSWSITLPLSLATCISFGVVIGWLHRTRWLTAFTLMFALLQIDTLKDWRAVDFLPDLKGRFATTREMYELATRLRNAKGPVLTDEYIGLLSLAGKAPVIYPLEFNTLQQRGDWSSTELIAAIERRDFALVAWYEPQDRNELYILTRWPDDVRKAIYKNYTEAGYMADTVLYQPVQR